MRPMRRLLAIIACTVLAACTGAALPADAEPDGFSDGPQLLTEQYLRRQLDLHVIQTIDEPLAQAMYDEHVTVVNSGLLATWDKDPVGFIVYRPRGWVGTPFTMHVRFGSPNYSADGGTVNEHDCKELPGAGVQTTGEFTSITNGIEGVIEHKVSKSVTETNSVSNTLSQSLDLTSGQSFEAGYEFGGASAKATVSFEQHFGFSSESVSSSSTETNTTVEDVAEVPSMRVYRFVFTTDNATTVCLLTISATGDWGALEILPVRGRPFRQTSTWCSRAHDETGGNASFTGRGSNGDLLLRSDAVDRRSCVVKLDEADGLIRLFAGYDVRCPNCGRLKFDASGSRALEWFGMKQSRHVSFDGRRNSGSQKDASYKALDVTGFDQGCVDDVLDDVGTPVTDDLLDECAP